MSTGPDRLALLHAHATLNGIDLVVVNGDQTKIIVSFVNPPSPALEAALDISVVQLTPAPIDGTPAPPVTSVTFLGVSSNRRMMIHFATSGPFNHQRLTLAHPLMDSFFGTTLFNFKAGCPSPFDCRDAPDCPEPDRLAPIIDYSARDFESYRRVLLDYAETHWPEWRERHLPDVGNMMVDLMAYLGAELAYYQDRVARETTLQLATQPRSLRAHARLMDYEIAPAMGAHGLIDVQVDPAGGGAGSVVAGHAVAAVTTEGQRIVFETGIGLANVDTPQSWPVNAALNAVSPHLFDEDETCLPRGATDFYVSGALQALLPLIDNLADGTPVRQLLLRTDPENGATPESSGAAEKRIVVFASNITDTTDPLLAISITHITLAHPLPVDLDLTTLTLHANLVPVSAGETRDDMTLIVGERADANPALPADLRAALVETIERNGPGEQPLQRYYLPDTADIPLVWLSPNGTGPAAIPVVEITAVSWDGAVLASEDIWSWRRSLLGSVSSLPDSLDFTIEDGRWDVVRRFDHLNMPFEWRDYAGPQGATIRFGDGEFGRSPPRGTLFSLRYKVGGGAASNLGADTLSEIAPDALIGGITVTVSNPFALTNGADAETLDAVRLAAPEAWKAETFRAVRPEDYSEAAERLEWVDRAETRTRWTGSWLSTMTVPDPSDRADLPQHRRAELDTWLGRFRMAGRDARVADPIYADLDFQITICVAANHERSDVMRRIQTRLSNRRGGFFDPNARSFGDSVERARLEASIHDAGGVKAVEMIRFRRRGWFSWRDLGTRYRPEGGAELIRVENDPRCPDRGTITLMMEGGA